jgi:preprotein translocase subunit Sss1
VLFDLRGKRKRVVQVVYVALAGIFLVGFVGFGIGVGGGPGGIFDALGIGNGGSGSTSSAFNQQISTAQARVKKDPKDPSALLNLARYEYLSGQAQLGPADSTTGQPTVTDAAQAQFVKAVDAWDRYLKAAKKPDPAVASQIAQGFVFLNDATGAAKAEAIFAKARPSQNTYGTLALYLYADGQITAGDAAAKKAVAAAPASSRKQLTKQLADYSKRAQKFKKAQAAAASASGQGSGGQSLQNPFGGLGPTTSTPTP